MKPWTMGGLALCGMIGCVVLGGCGGDAKMELSAADALLATANQMELVINEYHDEIARFDDSRESAVVSAFVSRVRQNPTDDTAIETHVSDFKTALGKIRGDRETEFTRRIAASENVGVLREMAKGLQKLALESLTLEDEMRRYLGEWIETRKQVQDTVSGTEAQP